MNTQFRVGDLVNYISVKWNGTDLEEVFSLCEIIAISSHNYSRFLIYTVERKEDGRIWEASAEDLCIAYTEEFLKKYL